MKKLFKYVILIFLILLGITALPSKTAASFQLVPNSSLKYVIVGDAPSKLVLDYKYDNDYFSYSVERDLYNKRVSSIYIQPPLPDTNIQISVTAVGKSGKRSSPKIFTNKQWWSLESIDYLKTRFHIFFIL